MYLVHRLLTLLVLLGFFLHLLSLLYLIDELEQVPQVQNHRLSLGRERYITHPLTHRHTLYTLIPLIRTPKLQQRLLILVIWRLMLTELALPHDRRLKPWSDQH